MLRILFVILTLCVVNPSSANPVERAGRPAPPTRSSIEINLPDQRSAPDGTSVNATNMGVYSTSGTATYETYPDGERYIRVAPGNIFVFTTESPEIIDGATHYAYEFGIRYRLAEGETWQNIADGHQSVRIEDGGTHFRLYSRPMFAFKGIMLTVDSEDELSANETTNRDHGNVLKNDQPVRIGLYHMRGESGFLGAMLDGMPVCHLSGVDSSGLNTLRTFGRFTPTDSSYLETHITGPIRIWHDESFVQEMVPDRLDDALGLKARWYEHITMDLGPFERTDESSTTLQALRYVFGGGTQQKRYKLMNFGSQDATIELRPEHSLGKLDKMSDDRACLVFPMIYAPGNNSFRIELGSQDDGDVLDLLFDGSGADLNNQKIRINGIESGLEYSQSRRYKLSLLFDENDNASSIILEDLTSIGLTTVRLFGAGWDRAGGIPSIHKIKLTASGTRCEFELPVNPPTMDVVIASSYTNNRSTNVIPLMSNTNHVGWGWDHFPDASSRVNTGILSMNPFGRSGRSITEMDEALDQYAPFQYMKDCRVVAAEWVVNDMANVSRVVNEMKLLISACLINDVRLLVCTSIPRPANGVNDVSDEYRADQHEINRLVIEQLYQGNRPDLLFLSDVAGEYTDEQAALDFYNAFLDDIHFEPSGDLLYASKVIELMHWVCKPDVNRDNALDIFDVFAFIESFNDQESGADFNGDEFFDIFDVFSFIESFNIGCTE